MAEENEPNPEDQIAAAFVKGLKQYDAERAEWEQAIAATKTPENDPPPKPEKTGLAGFLLGKPKE